MSPFRSYRQLCQYALTFLLYSLLTGCSLLSDAVPRVIPIYRNIPDNSQLLASVAKIDITPKEPLFMGGYKIARKHHGIHDPLYVRALVLKQGKLELAFVTVDVVGLQWQEVEKMKNSITGWHPRHVLIHSTHNHSSPDTLGLWGLPPFISGIDRDYMNKITLAIHQAIEKAKSELTPAEFASGSVIVSSQGMLRNLRNEGIEDRELVVFHLRRPDDKSTIATVAELGCHPEVIGKENHLLTADYPSTLIKRLEDEYGGTALYVSGALGGLITPDTSWNPKTYWPELNRMGNLVADYAVHAISQLNDYESKPTIRIWHSPLYLPNHNLL